MCVAKRRFTVALCFIALITATQAPHAMALDVNVSSGYTEIMPMMEYIYDADYDFVISGGKANMYAVVNGNSTEATKCEVTVELQEKGLLFWDTLGTWTATENGRRAELDVSQSISKGKAYRMVTTVTVWSGTASETKTMTSRTLET